MKVEVAFVLCLAGAAAAAPARPNLVWLVSEDNSMHYYRHFFEGGAPTPAISGLAEEGLTYTNAYSNAPVCSAARSALQTGVLGPKWGTQFHRALKKPSVRNVSMVQQYLRKAGYYTTNKVKTDYNFFVPDGGESWHENSGRSSWRNRPNSTTPFFYMETFRNSHESTLHFNMREFRRRIARRSDRELNAIDLPPYLPDTRMQRFYYWQFLQIIRAVDRRIRGVVDQLEADGLLQDTFVFYFSDHGGVLPRSKGYMYDSGLHVPLVVRIPENFRNSVGVEIGSTVRGAVQFIDFAPTLLELAGINVPSHMDGKPFLSLSGLTDVATRDETYAYANRMDEKYDMIRSLRKGRYHYVRNYEPHLPNGFYTNFRYRCLAYRQWRDRSKAGRLRGAPARFFERKPLEMLFDTDSDPHEVNNLAANPEFASVLEDLRERLNAKAASIPDLGFYPESFLIENNFADELKDETRIRRFVELSAMQLQPWRTVRDSVVSAVNSNDPIEKLWGYRVASAFVSQDALLDAAASDIADTSLPAAVRVQALYYVGLEGSVNPQPGLRDIINTETQVAAVLEALNAAAYFHDYSDFRAQGGRLNPRPAVRNNRDIQKRINYIRNN